MEQEEFIVKEEIFYNTEVKVFGNNIDIPNLYKVLSGFELKTF
jgi:putative transposon-encoded protein